jgi:hypothetical protein
MKPDSFTTFFKRYRYVLTIAVLFVIGEIYFSIAEIGVGRIMLWTNPLRPKVGRLWQEEAKDEAGKNQVTNLVDSLSHTPFRSGPIRTMDDLQALVKFKSRVVLTPRDFVTLYSALPDSQTRALIDPMLLTDLRRNDSWQSVSLTSDQGTLTCIFMDGYGQPLLVTHAGGQPEETATDSLHVSQLELDENFRSRLVPPELFVAAYERLPARWQLQIFNDPDKFTNIKDSLIAVAIAPIVENGAVCIACEVRRGISNQIITLQASEMAVQYLITAIQEMGQHEIELTMPRQQEVGL